MKVSILSLIFLSLCFVMLSQAVMSQDLYDHPESVVYDSLNDRYIVSNIGNLQGTGSGYLIQVNSLGIQDTFSVLLKRVAGLFILDDYLYCASNYPPYVGLMGFDLTTDELVVNIPISNVGLLNDLTTDNNGNIYITDFWDTKVFKVDLETETYSIFALAGLTQPNGIYFDDVNTRLIVTSVISPTYPLYAISIEDGSVSTILNTYIGSQDGIARDNDGFYYLSSWATNSVYKFNPDFSGSSEVFSSGHNGPADIYVNLHDNILCVPNYNINTVEFIEIPQNDIIDLNKVKGAELITLQNYPNPFNPKTTIFFDVPFKSVCNLKILNIKGQIVKTLLNDEVEAGSHQINWNGKNDNFEDVSSGIYFYQIEIDDETITKKMIMIK